MTNLQRIKIQGPQGPYTELPDRPYTAHRFDFADKARYEHTNSTSIGVDKLGLEHNGRRRGRLVRSSLVDLTELHAIHPVRIAYLPPNASGTPQRIIFGKSAPSGNGRRFDEVDTTGASALLVTRVQGPDGPTYRLETRAQWPKAKDKSL